MNNQNEFQSTSPQQSSSVITNSRDRDDRLATNNRPEEKEKKDHGPNLPEKDLDVKRPSTPKVDPTQKQDMETN
ncbi:MAG: hypothetical protein JNL11_20190 [Bdellovibrionaceae bacterium]|nr:hypothetical protein [Pseudobdellovibrionaceae bacterium]